MMNLGDADENKVNDLKKQLNEKLDVYETILSKQPYLAGQVNRRLLFSFYIINIFLCFFLIDIYFSRFISFTIWFFFG